MGKKILIINGPNLNLLGKREAIHYGKTTFEGLKKECENYAKKIGIKIEFKQTNIEGEIVSLIQGTDDSYDGLIINAAGYTHTSVSILDALKIIKIPSVELHISNIHSREEFRHKSLISNAVKGIICGFGTKGYLMAIDGLINLIEKK
jgi:3-dehydroquinate dehydratase-2